MIGWPSPYPDQEDAPPPPFYYTSLQSVSVFGPASEMVSLAFAKLSISANVQVKFNTHPKDPTVYDQGSSTGPEVKSSPRVSSTMS